MQRVFRDRRGGKDLKERLNVEGSTAPPTPDALVRVVDPPRGEQAVLVVALGQLRAGEGMLCA